MMPADPATRRQDSMVPSPGRTSVLLLLLLALLVAQPTRCRTFDDAPPQPPLTGQQQPTYTLAPSTTTTTTTPSTTVDAATAGDSEPSDPTTTPPPSDPANDTLADDPSAACFYAEPELCTEPRPDTTTGGAAAASTCRECFAHPTVPNSLVCCNVSGDLERAIACVPPGQQPNGDHNATQHHYWTNLHVRNATLDELDFSHKYWKRLDSLAVTDGRVQRIVNEFSKFSSPQCINVSNNQLHLIHQRTFRELTRLQVLDLSHNNLSAMPNVNSNLASLSLDVSGNREMLCKSILESMERGGVHFVDPDGTFCLTNQTFTWFNSTDSVSLGELVMLRQMPNECPTIAGRGSCKCDTTRMMYEHSSKHFRISAQVDCSNMGLTALPDKLPENTVFLNVSMNNITSLFAFTHPSYEQILKLEADDNLVNSLLELEGTKFLQNFLVLRLRRNRLRTIPIYMLSNTLDSSPNGRAVNLGGNQLHCDCNSAKVTKNWLMERLLLITDSDQIGCVNMPQMVMELSETKLCQSPHDWTDYIYYLIGLEIVLLVAVVCKVSYDYWVFKTAGYLPWPASQMPKLPCDWLCES